MDVILLCGASAITDRQDELPQAVQLAGGKIDRFGLPVDPGNLLMLAHLGAVNSDAGNWHARLCALAELNGLDWVLQLVLADIDVNGRMCRYGGWWFVDGDCVATDAARCNAPFGRRSWLVYYWRPVSHGGWARLINCWLR